MNYTFIAGINLEKDKLPECHFCHNEIVEGNKLKTNITERTVYVCFDCTELIAAVAHDFAGVLNDLTHIMDNPSETWKERLEPWTIKEASA